MNLIQWYFVKSVTVSSVFWSSSWGYGSLLALVFNEYFSDNEVLAPDLWRFLSFTSASVSSLFSKETKETIGELFFTTLVSVLRLLDSGISISAIESQKQNYKVRPRNHFIIATLSLHVCSRNTLKFSLYS